MKLLLTFCILSFAFCCRAATITANSVSRVDVGAAVASASDGDTVIIPAGSAHWTTNLYINKAITLQGTGTNASTGTVVYDDVTTGLGNGAALIWIQTTFGKPYRLSGINVPYGSTSANGAGCIAVTGLSTLVRIDTCWFQTRRSWAVAPYDVFGVIDHCTFCTNLISFQCGNRWTNEVGTTRTDGTGSWSMPDFFGTTNAMYVEDCLLVKSGSDGYNGARFVFRHCTMIDSHLDSHEDIRPLRSVICESNDFTATDGNGIMVYSRGGTVLCDGNIMHGSYGASINAVNYRALQAIETPQVTTGFGMAWGTNDIDAHAPASSDTGTYNGTNGAIYSITVTGKNWTTDQWAGYTCLNTTIGRTNVWGPIGDLIYYNNSNTLTFFSNLPQPDRQQFWTNGFTFAIYYQTNTADMCGMGQCAVVLTNEPALQRMNLRQAVSPDYSWNNIPDITVSAYPNIRSGIHYFDHTAKPSYTPLVYPHPLQNASIVAAPNDNVTTVEKIYY